MFVCPLFKEKVKLCSLFTSRKLTEALSSKNVSCLCSKRFHILIVSSLEPEITYL